MRVRLPDAIQKELLKLAIAKAGSERKLEKRLNIPKISIYLYMNNKQTLSLERFEKIVRFLEMDPDSLSKSIVFIPDNWGRQKGGQACVRIKRKKGTFDAQLATARAKGGSSSLKRWHSEFRRKNPMAYFEVQHSRFRKAGADKYQTLNGERVRNLFEKQVADYFFYNKINYLYEPCIKIQGRTYFPDFMVGTTIVECTMWNGESKASSLAKKIQAFESEGYRIFVFIPPNLREIYKEINRYIVSNFEDLRVKLCLGSSASV